MAATTATPVSSSTARSGHELPTQPSTNKTAMTSQSRQLPQSPHPRRKANISPGLSQSREGLHALLWLSATPLRSYAGGGPEAPPATPVQVNA